MKLFQDIPPLGPEADFTAKLDWAARRDPVGHKVHLVLAVLALAMLPLSSSAATIGSTLLIGYALLRSPTIFHCWGGLHRNKSLICLILLLLWLLASTLWSADPEHGLRLLRGSRYILLIPALLPLLRHASILMYATCAGVLIQNAVQLYKVGTIPGYFGGGLDSHPGFAGLWFILCAALFATGAGLHETNGGFTKRRGWILGILSVVTMLGTTITEARSILLGMGIGLGTLCAWSLLKRPRNWKGTTARSIVMLVILVGTSPLGPFQFGAREAELQTSLLSNSADQSDADETARNMNNVRFVWWDIGLDRLRSNWLAGDGLGSAESAIKSHPTIDELTEGRTKNLFHLRDDYHSLFVTIAADSGIIGLALLLAWLFTLARQIPNGMAYAPVLAIAFIGYLTFSAFNTKCEKRFEIGSCRKHSF